MLRWCPCMGWCLAESSTNEAKVLLNSMTTPTYNVRRISSFGQTVVNESGEEEEIARHGTVPNRVTNGAAATPASIPSWATATVPVQPGVSKSDVVPGRLHKMASIPETASPKPRNRLMKHHSEELKGPDNSPLTTRKKIPIPQDFAQPALHHQQDEEPSSITSEAHSDRSTRSRNTDDEKSKNNAEPVHTYKSTDDNHQTITVEAKIEKKESKSSSLFGLVKSIKSSSSSGDKPKSPWVKNKNSSGDKLKTPASSRKASLDVTKTPISSRRNSSSDKPKTPVPSRRNSSDKPQTPVMSHKDTSETPDIPAAKPRKASDPKPNIEDEKTPSPKTRSHHQIETPTPPPRPRKSPDTPKIIVDEVIEKEEKEIEETEMEQYKERRESVREMTTEEDEPYQAQDEVDEDNLSQTPSQSTTRDDDEVGVDGSRSLNSAEIAKQYGLDLSLYDTDSFTNIGLKSGGDDDDLSANTSIGRIHFTTNLDKEKNMLLITVDRIEGLGGVGPNNLPFDVVVKLGFTKGSSTQSTKPCLYNKKIDQNFSLHVKDLATSILRLTVYNGSWQGSHDALGYALFRVSKCTQTLSRHAVSVSPKSNVSESAGLIEISFRLDSKTLHVIVHKVFDILPVYRSYKMYIKVCQFISSKKMKEKISKTEAGEKGFINLDFESKFKCDNLMEQHWFMMVSLKRKSENNKLFKSDKTLGRVVLGPLYHTANKLNLWGQAVLQQKIMTHSFTFYT